MSVMGKTKIIVFSNQKGGVGKTTSAVCVASELKSRNHKVLVIDLDFQCNCTDHAGGKRGNGVKDIMQVLKEECPALDAVQHLDMFDLIPGSADLEVADVQFATDLGRHLRLKNALASIVDCYDYIIIDTHPDKALPTLNAIVAATHVIIPCDPVPYAASGLAVEVGFIRQAKKYFNPSLQMSVLMTKTLHYKTSVALANEIKALCHSGNIPVLDAMIRTSSKVATSQKEQKAMCEIFKDNNVTKDYASLVDLLIREDNAK